MEQRAWRRALATGSLAVKVHTVGKSTTDIMGSVSDIVDQGIEVGRYVLIGALEQATDRHGFVPVDACPQEEEDERVQTGDGAEAIARREED